MKNLDAQLVDSAIDALAITRMTLAGEIFPARQLIDKQAPLALATGFIRIIQDLSESLAEATGQDRDEVLDETMEHLMGKLLTSPPKTSRP